MMLCMAGRELPECSGGGGHVRAQPHHRPPQPPRLCAESLHEGTLATNILPIVLKA